MNKYALHLPIILILAFITLLTGCNDPAPETEPRLTPLGIKIQELSSPDETVREAATTELKKLEEISADHVPGLESALDSEFPESIDVAIKMLCRVKPYNCETIPVLKKAMDTSTDVYVKKEIIENLEGYIDDCPEATALLLNILETGGSRGVFVAAIEALAAIDKPGEAVMLKLVGLMAHTDSVIWASAADTLARIGESALPYLMKGVNGDRELNWGSYSSAMHGIGQPSLPLLLVALAGGEGKPARNAAVILQKFLIEDGKEIFADHGDVDRIALRININLPGGIPIKFFPELLEIYNTGGLDDRVEMITAIRKVRPWKDEAIDVVLDAMSAPDPEVRGSAVQGLKSIKPYSDTVLSAMLDAFEDPDDIVRSHAEQSFGTWYPRLEKQFFPVYRKYLGHSNPYLYYSVLVTLKEGNGIETDDLIRHYSILLKSDDQEVRAVVASDIQAHSIEEPNEYTSCIPALIDALDDDNATVVEIAVKALGYFGPPAKAALPKLEDIAAQESHVNRTYSENAIQGAKQAIVRIEGD